jgi:hypothetical protein
VLTLFQFLQTVFWVGLSTWFGIGLFIAVAAPIIFRVTREHDPTLPLVLSVNLDQQHSTLLASSIVAKIMQTTTRLALVCAIAVLIGLLGHWLIVRPVGNGLMQAGIRSALFLLATIVLVYDWRVVSPRLFAFRDTYIEQADNPEIANHAKDQFDRLSRENVNMLFLQTLLLLGLILFSANVSYTRIGV